MPPRKRALSKTSPDAPSAPTGKKAKTSSVAHPPAVKRAKPAPQAPTRQSTRQLTRLQGKVQPAAADENSQSTMPPPPAVSPTSSPAPFGPPDASHESPNDLLVQQPLAPEVPEPENHGASPEGPHGPDLGGRPQSTTGRDIGDAAADTSQAHRIASRNADARAAALQDELDAAALKLLESIPIQNLVTTLPEMTSQDTVVQEPEPLAPQEPPATETPGPVSGPTDGHTNTVDDALGKRRTKPAKLKKGVRMPIPYSLLYKFKEGAERKQAVLVEAPVFRTTTPLQTKSAKGIADHMGDIWLHATEGIQKTLDLAPGFAMVFYRPQTGNHANVRTFWSPSIQEQFSASQETFEATDYGSNSADQPRKTTVHVPQVVDEIVRQFCILTDPLVDKPSTQQADTIRTLATKNDELEREKMEAIQKQREAEEKAAALERELAALRARSN